MKKLIALMATTSLLAVPALAQTKFIASSWYDAGVPMSSPGYVEWAELVKELSGGDLQPEVFIGTVLLAPRAAGQGIRDNVVQVGHHAAIFTPSDMPVASAMNELGFNFDDPVPTIFAVAEFSMNNAAQLQEWKDNGIVYLGAYTTPPYVLMCSSPVRNLAELSGKRIRTAGSAVSIWVEEAGGIPVNVPSSEMYTGLERGTLDCATNAASDLVDRSLMEVAKHTTLASTGMYWSGPQWGFNRGFWQTLTPAQRSVLMEASARSMARIVIAYNTNVANALEKAAAAGGNIYEPEADLMASIEAFRERTLATINDTARDSFGIENADEVVSDFVSAMERWKELLADVDPMDEDALTEIAMREIFSKIDPATYGVD